MTRLDHLLWILAEECAEVAQRASKAARFGLAEVQPGQSLTNAQRIEKEFADLIGIYEMLANEARLDCIASFRDDITAKQDKIERFLKFSRDVCGTLD